jgi:hypothetical protein
MCGFSVSETCVIAEEISRVEAESRAKAKRYVEQQGVYNQVAVELARIGRRHFARCSTCQQIEAERQVAA